jgi:hypothetical protein
LKEYLEHTRLNSLEILRWLCIKDNFLDHVMLPWLKAESQIPSTSTMWLLFSGKMDAMTPNGTPSALLQDFYGGN